MALSQTTVLKVYKSVMEDVIAGVREMFLDDGVDEQVLVELRHIWENKLLSSKAIDINPEPPEPQPPLVTTVASANSTSGSVGNHSGLANTLYPAAKKTHQSSIVQQGNSHFQSSTSVVQPPPNPSTANAAQTNVLPEPNKTVPVQITLPPQAGSSDTHSRVLTIQVPASALQGNQLHSVLSGPVISATMALPLHLATSLLQQHVTTALQGQQQQAAAAAAASNNTPTNNAVSNASGMHGKPPSIIQSGNLSGSSNTGGVLVLGKGPSGGLIRQLDGVDDTSDDEEEEEEEEEDAEEEEEENDDKDEEEEEDNDGVGGAEEEPLNSEDDVSDEDPTDLFDTDNVVVCQYDKITRSRNKWKFYLKDGIMNLGGKDFVFQRANGDAEW